ncbi:MAG: HMA2 domain-containing protein [Sporomusa sp.]
MDLSSLYSSTKMNLLLKQTRVVHYMPGRVRLYSQYLLNNQNIACKIKEHLATIPEIIDFAINTATGSLLIQYSPESVSHNPLLRDIEQWVAKQYGR